MKTTSIVFTTKGTYFESPEWMRVFAVPVEELASLGSSIEHMFLGYALRLTYVADLK